MARYLFILFSWILIPTYLLADDAVAPAWGLDQSTFEDPLQTLQQSKKPIGIDFLICAWKEDFSSPFPLNKCIQVANANKIPFIKWDAEFSSKDKNVSYFIKLQEILRGDYDVYLNSWAESAAQFKKPVLIQFLRQFNNSVKSWSIAANEEKASLVAEAFRKAVSVFRDRGAKNVKWVWGPDIFPSPVAGWNQWEEAYPGDSHVDFLSLDGLDFGGLDQKKIPLSFEELFSSPYHRLKRLTDRKPILITEVATIRTGADRNEWLLEMIESLNGSLSNIHGLIWFQQTKNSVDWRLRKEDQEVIRKIKSQSIPTIDNFFERPFWPMQIQLPWSKKEASRSVSKWQAPYVLEIHKAEIPTALQNASVLYLDPTSARLIGRKMPENAPLIAKLRFGWNSSGLLFWCQVEDTTPGEGHAEPEKIEDGDNLELDLGLLPSENSQVSLASCYRILTSPGGPRQLKPSFAFLHGRDGAIDKTIEEMILHSQFGVGLGGYRIYGLIPWRLLGIEPKEQMKFLFNITVTDGVDGHRARQLIWAGGAHYYHDVSEWGILELMPPSL